MSKVANEHLSNVFMMLNQNLLITSLNFFNTYGPTEGKDAVIPNFISKAMNNELIMIEGDGNQARDFTYIDDTIDLLVKIFQNNNFYRSISDPPTYLPVHAETVWQLTSLKTRNNDKFST